MKSNENHWSKTELQIYILLLCANADSIETEEEMELIKSKTNMQTLKKLYNEYTGDSEDERLEKISKNLQFHDFTHMELMEFREEINEVFHADKKFTMMERNLDRILDNIIY
ncbi:hypothetical protein HZY62_10835 [Maribacter polysiphoniae]|uniref:Tellurite resistance protein TerB n=1 Tax=Maribacter polysiphoniae TaxID=429344 RepID=A0A316DZU2_9FLAO|nr:hypothetical protein [Maribacter polysiphoniae]MBD1261085.1 hypothetical protein [Maribacter polysiphoniae]PWK23674.1 hypothetical protein LX92_02241 [Maribacter polysiphoniae]